MLAEIVLDEIAVFGDVRLGDVVILQLRSAVEPEYLGGRLATFLQEDSDHVDGHRSDFQGATDRIGQFSQLVLFQETQDPIASCDRNLKEPGNMRARCAHVAT